jgi:hypothetical protein
MSACRSTVRDPLGPPNNGLVLAVRSASLRSAQRPSAQAAAVGLVGLAKSGPEAAGTPQSARTCKLRQ